MKNKFPYIVFLLSVFLSSDVFAELFDAAEFTLDNGLRCVVIQNHKAPLIKQMVWYGAGAADEEPGRGGSAHLLEHLMFRGSDKVKDGEFNRVMMENGAEANAFTGHDITAYHEFADISRLEILMAFEADRMRSLNFDERAFAAEQKIVFQERKQTVENNLSAAFYEKIRRDLFGISPYGKPVTGENEEIRKLTYADVRDFYERFYVPNNALLVLAGDIDTETARSLAEKYYGDIPSRPAERKKAENGAEFFRQSFTMRLRGVKTPKIVRTYLLPNYADLKGSFYDYLVLAAYLGGGETSALYRDLVVESGKAVGVSASYDFVTRGNGTFRLVLIPSENASEDLPALLRESVMRAMDKLDNTKLEKVKRKMLADLVFAKDNPEEAANLAGYMLANGFSLEDMQNYENGVSAVELPGVLKAYKQIIRKASFVEGVLLPEKEKTDD